MAVTSKRQLITAYLLMVGIPLLGLVGILRVGSHLTAPLSVGGRWNVEADFKSLASSPCGAVLASAEQPRLRIVQSGRDLILTLNNGLRTTVPATLDGSTLTTGTASPDAVQRVAAVIPGCSGPESIYLDGTVSRQGSQEFLTGQVILKTCPECAPVQFYAVRMVPPRRRAL